MPKVTIPLPEVPHTTRGYLAARLDGARDLYLLALALGARGAQSRVFGPMIREARIHFVAVLEEGRSAGLDTRATAAMLAVLGAAVMTVPAHVPWLTIPMSM